MYAKKNSGKKVVLTLLAIVLLIGCTIGATVAYLVTRTDSVTNTFVVGDIGTLTLEEDGEAAANQTKSFTIIPGVDLAKNVTVSYVYNDNAEDMKSAVDVYVFVKVNATGWSVDGTGEGATHKKYTVGANLLSWSIANGWDFVTTESDGSKVYCRVVGKNETLADAAVIASLSTTAEGEATSNTAKHIAVSNNITKGNIDEVAAAAGNITFTAYAIQKDGFDSASAAWTQAKTASTN